MKKPGTSPPGDPREIEREALLLERAAVVVPDEPSAPCGAPDGVEALGVGAPHAVDRLAPEPGGAHPLEALAVVAEDRRAGTGHEHGPVRERLHPPEIAARSGVELGPRFPVEVENERTVPLVGSNRIDVRPGPPAHREERRGELAREELPLALGRRGGVLRLLAPGQSAGRNAESERRERDGSPASTRASRPLHGLITVGAICTRRVDVTVAPAESVTVTWRSRGLPRNCL